MAQVTNKCGPFKLYAKLNAWLFESSVCHGSVLYALEPFIHWNSDERNALLLYMKTRLKKNHEKNKNLS